LSEQLAITLIAASVGFLSAIFFSIGNILNSVERITLQATPFWDFSEPVARALASQRAQYVTGGLLLLASFVLQVLAALVSSTTPANLPQWLCTGPRLVLSVLAPIGFLSWLFCNFLDRSTIGKVLSRQAEELATEEQAAKKNVPSQAP
jgi:hypothetical protein